MKNYLREVEPEEVYAGRLSAPRSPEEHELAATETPGAGRDPDREEDGIENLVEVEAVRLNLMPKRFSVARNN